VLASFALPLLDCYPPILPGENCVAFWEPRLTNRGQPARHSLPQFQTTGRSRENDDEDEYEARQRWLLSLIQPRELLELVSPFRPESIQLLRRETPSPIADRLTGRIHTGFTP
jgi:hypothetical protein